ncbi:hypothetical protein K1719_021719 [Acacia pycnantha]|nr:hypothetical protein K1719_021719 [Acacia pycnantha]
MMILLVTGEADTAATCFLTFTSNTGEKGLSGSRTVTWVNWSMGGPHPATYGRENITMGFIQAIRDNGTLCRYNSQITSVFFLFDRKFDSSALEPLLNLSSTVIHF